MADGEEADVEKDVLHSVQKKDDADQEQEMVIPCDHMLRAQIHERADCSAFVGLYKLRIALGNTVRVRDARKDHAAEDQR